MNQYKKWSREEIVDAVQAFYKDNGRSPASRDFTMANGMPSISMIKSVFGESSVSYICKVCGIEQIPYGTNGTTDFEWEIKTTTNRVKRYCEECGELYDIVLSQHKKGSKCCSEECFKKWNKKNVRTGVDNPLFTQKQVECHTCGELHYKKPSKISENGYNFCNRECFNIWLKSRSQTDEWKLSRSIIATNALCNGSIPTIDTTPHKIVRENLDALKINSDSEVNFKYYAIDLFLTDYNIPVEVMGDYWHANHKMYSELNYKHQVDRIYRDKAKHNYLLNNHNMEILYLWENDIMNNLDACIELVKRYIKNGFLENYHSFNYIIHDGRLKVNDNIEFPYMEMDKDFITSITNLDVIKSRRKRDDSNYITFNCEYCGKEKEQLVSKHKNSKNHFCSYECNYAYSGKLNSVEVECFKCGIKVRVKNSVYNKSTTKRFTCEKCKPRKG
jgi:very-short-patch-repair endonuclease